MTLVTFRLNKKRALTIGIVCCALVLVFAGLFFIGGNADSKNALFSTTKEAQKSSSPDNRLTANKEQFVKPQEKQGGNTSGGASESLPDTNSDTAANTEDVLPNSSAPDTEDGSGQAFVQTPAPAPEPALESIPEPAPKQDIIAVSVGIDGSRGGGAVSLVQVSVPLGSSVYEALCATGAQVSRGSGGYVSAINGLSEFSNGPGSGWIYFVNGTSPGYSSALYELQGGESVNWIYTLDFGNDF